MTEPRARDRRATIVASRRQVGEYVFYETTARYFGLSVRVFLETADALAWLRHLGWTVLAFVPFLAVTALQRRLPDPFRLSADDAMGVGIDFLILVVLAAGFASAQAAALAGLVARRRSRLGTVEEAR